VSEHSELKPCPFCGGKAKLASYRSCDCCGKAYNAAVCCPSCMAEVSHYDTDDEAVEVWNSRVTFEVQA